MDASHAQPYDEVKLAEESFEKSLLLEPDVYKPPSFKKEGLKKKIALHTLVFLLAIAVTSLAGFLIRPFPPRTPHIKTLHCGTNSSEARALDCTYDVLSNIWVPTPVLTERISTTSSVSPSGRHTKHATRHACWPRTKWAMSLNQTRISRPSGSIWFTARWCGDGCTGAIRRIRSIWTSMSGHTRIQCIVRSSWWISWRSRGQ